MAKPHDKFSLEIRNSIFRLGAALALALASAPLAEAGNNGANPNVFLSPPYQIDISNGTWTSTYPNGPAVTLSHGLQNSFRVNDVLAGEGGAGQYTTVGNYDGFGPMVAMVAGQPYTFAATVFNSATASDLLLGVDNKAFGGTTGFSIARFSPSTCLHTSNSPIIQASSTFPDIWNQVPNQPFAGICRVSITFTPTVSGTFRVEVQGTGPGQTLQAANPFFAQNAINYPMAPDVEDGENVFFGLSDQSLKAQWGGSGSITDGVPVIAPFHLATVIGTISNTFADNGGAAYIDNWAGVELWIKKCTTSHPIAVSLQLSHDGFAPYQARRVVVDQTGAVTVQNGATATVYDAGPLWRVRIVSLSTIFGRRALLTTTLTAPSNGAAIAVAQPWIRYFNPN